VYNAKEQGMAQPDELELDVKATKSSGKGKLIMLIAAIMLLTTGTIIGVLYFMGMLGTHSESSPDKADNKKEIAVKPSFYLSLQPAFVVNFEDQTHASYLQVEMQVMAHSKHVLDIVDENMPVVRNNILFILSAQKYEQVSSRAGKEKLQKTILEAIQKVVADAAKAKQAGAKGKEEKKDAATKVANVQQVYFTSFIMQ
jgi:flagellar FliL protein